MSAPRNFLVLATSYRGGDLPVSPTPTDYELADLMSG